MGMRKALTEKQQLDLIYEAYDQGRKGERTVEEVSEDFGIARPSFYRYRSQIAKRLEKIGQDIDTLLENSSTAEAFRSNYINLINESKSMKQEEEKIQEEEQPTVQKIQKEIKKDIPGELVAKLNQRVKPLELKPEEPAAEESKVEVSQQKPTNKILLYGGLALIGIIVLLTIKKQNTTKQTASPITKEESNNYRPSNYVTAIEF